MFDLTALESGSFTKVRLRSLGSGEGSMEYRSATMYVRALAVSALLSLPGCATVRAPGFQAPEQLKWFRVAAERKAGFAQAYRQAESRVAQVQAKDWAVVIDADETILDNSAYQERLARKRGKWEQDTWDAWALEEKALVFPEAKAFLERVRELGGRIAVVSNRSDPTCDATRRNLKDVPFDVVLCAPIEDGKPNTDKEPRFAAVASGQAFGLPTPVSVVLYVGDNIKDCSRQTQQRFDAGRFGRDCIILPNPMYGSWQSLEYVPAEP